MCGINNDVTLNRLNRSRATGGCNEGDNNGNNASRPLNLFQGDTLNCGGGSGLFPRRPGGTGAIEDLLASLSGGDDKRRINTAGAADGLFSGGKDFGSASGCSDDQGGGGAGQALGQAMQGIQQVIGAVMNIVKAVMGIFGGL